jgi:sphingolipid delta-4 desaturase
MSSAKARGPDIQVPDGVSDFFRSPLPEPHRARTKWILERHPEVRHEIGKNPHTFWIIVGIVALQLGLAFLLRSSPWWLVVATAAIVGAFANHTLWVLIHECTHNLLFRSPGANTAAGILANLPHILPTSVMFQRYHLKHHAFQGVYELDADIPNTWEARLVGTSPWRKTIWMLLFAFMQLTRPPRLREIKPVDRWVVANFAAQIGFDVAVWMVLGPTAFFYLLASFFFSVGLHPLGARWIQEHYLVFPGQETTSYYGPLNTVALNVGYHNEHHDFPSVPWNRLPVLRRTAPEAYDTLGSYSSWSRLLWRFLFDRELSLFARQVRKNRGRVTLNSEVRPDMDLVESAGRVVREPAGSAALPEVDLRSPSESPAGL